MAKTRQTPDLSHVRTSQIVTRHLAQITQMPCGVHAPAAIDFVMMHRNWMMRRLAMAIVAASRSRPARLLLRGAVAIGCALALSGCVVYPYGGYYYRPAPAYYYGGGYYGYYR
jgi:hypothetical protein